LRRIQKFGSRYGFEKDDLAYSIVSDYKELYATVKDTTAFLSHSISKGKSSYKITSSITLPPLIISEIDVWSFEWPTSFPNFITQKSITGDFVSIDNKQKIKGSIVLIPNADPGYDWVFSHGIGGLITAFGGANSHMAIRAGELGLPSVIGTGEQLFNKLKVANRGIINCSEKQIRILS
jgi:phosphoenolpyruvate synthase/pyruvate phosphate dikinase